MNATLNDLQDQSSALDGRMIRNASELLTALENARERTPFIVEIEGNNGYKLTVGVGKDVGFVQYSSADGHVPYLVAVGEDKPSVDGYVEFLCGNTPTPIPTRNILPFVKVKEIAAYFIESGQRSPLVVWEEV